MLTALSIGLSVVQMGSDVSADDLLLALLSPSPVLLVQEPRRVVDRYAAGEGGEEGGQQRAFVSVNWVLTEEPLDLETELVSAGFLLASSLTR